MSKWILYPIILLFCCTGVFLKFHSNQENIPIGCDEFGYLSLAKAFDNNIAFQNHVERPYLDELLDTLRNSSIKEKEIEWMVVPHAYYVIPGSNKIINQYPPGTSYLLSKFSLPHRKQLFSSLAVFLFFIIPILVIPKKQKANFNWMDLSLVSFVFIMTLTTPFLTELTRINSVAFTFGLLVAAGISLGSRPLLSCFLIALSANFRTVNLLMLLPLIAFVPFPKKLPKENMAILFKMGSTYFLVVLLALIPYLLYVYLLLGNPFLPTYSGVDTAATSSGFKNMAYYLNFEQSWFIFHLILLAIFLILSSLKKMKWSLFFKLLLFPLVNYLFFIFHKVQINYYPYASSIIMLGVLFHEINKFQKDTKKEKLIAIICIVISLIVLMDGLNRYTNREHTSFEDKKNEYKILCNYDIVWGELYPGTAEYVCDNNGFKYGATTQRARKKAITFLHNKNYSQAILLTDNLVEEEDIISEVSSLGLKFNIVKDQVVGNILVIE